MPFHQTLNPSRYVTTPAQAEQRLRDQRGLTSMSDRINIKLAGLNQTVINKGAIDIGILNITDPATFNKKWSEL